MNPLQSVPRPVTTPTLHNPPAHNRPCTPDLARPVRHLQTMAYFQPRQPVISLQIPVIPASALTSQHPVTTPPFQPRDPSPSHPGPAPQAETSAEERGLQYQADHRGSSASPTTMPMTITDADQNTWTGLFGRISHDRWDFIGAVTQRAPDGTTWEGTFGDRDSGPRDFVGPVTRTTPAGTRSEGTFGDIGNGQQDFVGQVTRTTPDGTKTEGRFADRGNGTWGVIPEVVTAAQILIDMHSGTRA
jgi:hypothetical protein